jgi:antitoxin HigA-1
MANQKLPPIHPGKILQDHFFEPRGLTVKKVAKNIHVSEEELQKLIKGKSNLTTDMACRLSLYFQIGAKGFLNIQQIYDLECWKDSEEKRAKKQIHPYQETESNRKYA